LRYLSGRPELALVALPVIKRQANDAMAGFSG
jgi:hypothetical protein